VDSIEGIWNSGRDEKPNLGSSPLQRGLFPGAPMDHFQDLRSEMILVMESLGIEIEVQHHEVASVARPRSTCATTHFCAWRQTDALQVRREERRPQRRLFGDFHAKALFQDNGSGMHCHQSLWTTASPLLRRDGLRRAVGHGRWYIGGLLKHAAAVLAFAAPTTNSYKRLVPGYEAPVNLVYSQRNRSAACRIPSTQRARRQAGRVPLPGPGLQPYLAFSAMLMAGLDGVQNRIEPPDPMDKDFTTSARRARQRATGPGIFG